MSHHWKRRFASGQSLAEYGLLIGVVSVGVIAALMVMGDSVRQNVATISTNGTSEMGPIIGNAEIKVPNNMLGGKPKYNEAYPGDLTFAASVNKFYDPTSPKTTILGFYDTNATICGTRKGGSTAERCQGLGSEEELVENPDGSITITYSDGTVQTVFPDGSSEVQHPNGSIMIKDAEGNTTIEKPNGLRTETYASGGSKTTYPDGSTTSISANGKVTNTGPGGKPINCNNEPPSSLSQAQACG